MLDVMNEKITSMPSDLIGFLAALTEIERALYSCYQAFGQKNLDDGLKKIYRSLAEQEKNHIKVLQEIAEDLRAGDCGSTVVAGSHPVPSIESEDPRCREEGRAELVFSQAITWETAVCELLQAAWEAVTDPDMQYRLSALQEEEKKHIQWMKDRQDLEALRR